MEDKEVSEIARCVGVAVSALMINESHNKGEVADILDISPQHFSKVLNCKVEPSVALIEALGKFFGHDGPWLISFGKSLLQPYAGSDRRRAITLKDCLHLLEESAEVLTPYCLKGLYQTIETMVQACFLEKKVAELEYRLKGKKNGGKTVSEKIG